MNINITTGTGTGPTELSAFDAALNDAGVANFNLLCLSSVVPPNSTIVIHEGTLPTIKGDWGDRLYIVMAHQRVSNPGGEAWAGIGWVQDKVTKKGLFVEHEGTSEKSVRWDIEHSLKGLMETRGIDFGEINMVVEGGICTDKPFCAMVVAVYESAGWESRASEAIQKETAR
jgi:arginine decarboxylase